MNINEILKWFKKAVPEPTIENACIQIGCHYEEFSEMAVSIGNYGLADRVDSQASVFKACYSGCVNSIGSYDDSDKEELLDSLCDQIVTAIGVSHMLGMDIEGALDEVNRSNWSKFENGSPVFDENGKIKKGASYFKPDLTKFIGGEK